MTLKSDITIAQNAPIQKIKNIAAELQLNEDALIPYGQYKAKIDISKLTQQSKKSNGQLILVTAINPTPAGEGKTTTTIGLGDAFKQLNKKVVIALREPSLGPVFGLKGGASGGGMSQVIPMEEINLHFTGDFHAISAANNLLSALIDNHIFHGNTLNIDTKKISWKRCVDMNDRQLRKIINGLGAGNGIVREDGFDITVASEVMAILCLSENIEDLKNRLDKIIVAYSTSNEPITAAQLNATGAMLVLLKEAIQPNLVQTLEHTPTLIHGGPFANIAHGCNSVIATKLGMQLADYVITEAGFGADLGLEKFIDIKCRNANIYPASVVLVTTIRALKHHGGQKDQLATDDLLFLQQGMPHLIRHINNIKNVYKLPVVVAINRFPTDSESEINTIIEACRTINTPAILSEAWEKGGAGALKLAEEVIKNCNKSITPQYCYELSDTPVNKINQVVKNIYGGVNTLFSPQALQQLKMIDKQNLSHLPICIAKTPYSFSDDPKLIGAPENFEITIREVKISAGAGFIIALAGTVLTMPGLPKVPAAEKMNIDSRGKIVGLS